MGGRGSSSAGKATIMAAGASIPQLTIPAPSQTFIPTPTGVHFHNVTAHKFKQLFQQQGQVIDTYDIDTQLAIMQYIRRDHDDGNYTMSQKMNQKLRDIAEGKQGVMLNSTEQATYGALKQAMHPLGVNAVLTRAGHQGFVQRLLADIGAKSTNYEDYSEAQLNQMLKGVEYTENKFCSASADESKNPFITGKSSGGREVIVKYNTPRSAKVVFGDITQTEVILDPTTRYKVTGVEYTGKIATPRNAPSKRQIIVYVDVSA